MITEADVVDTPQIRDIEDSLGVTPAPSGPVNSQIGSDWSRLFGAGQTVNAVNPDPGFLEKALGYTATAPIRAVANTVQSVGNVFGVNNGEDNNFLTSDTLPAGKPGITDVLGGALLPAALSLKGVSNLIAPITKLAGLTEFPVLNRAVQEAAGFGTLGAQQDSATGLEQTGEGAAYGLLSALPRSQRLIPAAALALGSKAFFDRNGEQPTGIGDLGQGDLAGLLGFGASMLPGQTAFREAAKVAARPALADHFALMDRSDSQLALRPEEEAQQINPRPINQGPNFVGPEGTIYAAGPEASNLQALQNRPAPLELASAAEPRPPSPNQLFGISPSEIKEGDLLPQQTLSPEEQQAAALSKFRDQRVIYARNSPSVGAPITVDTNPMSIVPTDITPLGQRMFSPDTAEAFKNIGINSAAPEVQTAMQRLLLSLMTREVRESAVARRQAWIQFFEDAHTRPNVGSLAAEGPLAGEDAWAKVTGKPFQLSEEQALNPNPEGSTVPVKGMQRAVPEYRRTEGGNVDPEFLQYLGMAGVKAVGGAAAGAIGAKLTGHDDDVGTAAAIGAGLGLGLHFLPDIVAGLQAFKARRGSFLGSEAGSIPSGATPREAGVSNLDASIQKNINDAKMMRPSDPEGFLREYAQKAEAAGKPEVAKNFRAAADSILQSLQKPKEVIDEAAIKLANGKIFTGDNHFDAFKKAGEAGEKFGSNEIQPGFTTTVGRFVDRKEAYDIAISNNQVAKNAKGELTSEGMAKKNGEGGYVMPELSMALGRAAIGGFVGGALGGATDDRGDHSGFVMGAMIGATAGFFAPALAKGIAVALGNSKVVLPSTKSVASNFASIAKNWGTVLGEKAGAAFRGSDAISDRFAHWLDQELEITLPPEVKRTLLESRGQVSVLLDQIDKSLNKIGIFFSPSDDIKGITNKFLDGEFDSAEYNRQLQPFIANDKDVGHYANYAVTARNAIDAMIRISSDNLNNPKMAKIMKDSIGKYITRSYKLFTNPYWKPAPDVIEKLAKEIVDKKVWRSVTMEDARTYLSQYVREVKNTKGAYNAIQSVEGQAINQEVLKKRKDLSDAWREFLGEITDPRDRVNQTVARLRPMTEASKYFGDLTKTNVDGLPQVFKTYGEKDAFMQSVLQRLQNKKAAVDYVSGGDRNAIRQQLLSEGEDPKLITHLAELDGYQNVQNHPKYGELRGDIVSRGVWDTLKTFDSVNGMNDHPLMRSLANGNTIVKLMHTAYNPLTIIRNIMTIPAFMGIARVDPMVMPEAWRILKQEGHPMMEEMTRQGIANADQVKGEFFREWQRNSGPMSDWGTMDLSRLNMGKYDLQSLQKLGAKANSKVLDFYRVPDNLVRIAAYLSAKTRIAEKLGKAVSDPEVIQKATDFTNRYTMNYDAVSPLIKSLRQVPFVNLFISFQAEMARLAKNLVVDMVKDGDGITSHSRLYAAIPLATLAAVPDMVQSMTESNLNEKDQRDWTKAKELLPDYSRTRYRWVTGRDSNGQFHYVDYTPLVHSDSLNQMVKAIGNQDWKALAAINPIAGWENTPALNIVISQATGTDLQTKRPFRFGSEGAQDRIATIAKEILPPWTPSVGSEAGKFQQAYTPNTQGGLGTTSTKTGIGISPSDFWSSYVGAAAPGGSPVPGARTGSVNLQVLQKREVDEAKSQVANEMAYANDILKSNASDEVKKRVMDKTRLALANIIDSYRTKLSAP